MKPYVVFIKGAPKDGKITIEEEEFKRILEKAYNDGYNDGKQYTPYWYGNQYNGVINTNHSEPLKITYKDYKPNKNEVTCETTTNTRSNIK